MAAVGVRALHKAYGETIAVDGADFDVADGEMLALVGPAGSGKTTILRLLAGLETPASGRVEIGGRNVTLRRPAQRGVGLVFQDPVFYPRRDVFRNIAYPLESRRMSRARIRARVEEVVRELGLDHLIEAPVAGLDRADRYRVALARAVVGRPEALLLDEPFAGLDAADRAALVADIRELGRRLGIAMLIATRDVAEAAALATRLAAIRGGAIEQAGTPEDLYDRPATMFVAGLVGTPPMNLLSFHAGLNAGRRTVRLSGATITIPELRETVPPSNLALGVRPEHVAFSDKARLKGRITGIEYLGPAQIVSLETSHGTLRARLPANAEARIGEHHGIAFRNERLTLFDRASGRALRTVLNEEEAGHG